MYVDIHCHLDDKAFAADGPNAVADIVAAARAAGVRFAISNGTGQKSNEAVAALAAQHPLIRPAYGLYPTEPGTAQDDAAVLAWIRDQAIRGAHPPVAIGEIGLDGVEPVSEAQLERFRACLALAAELRLPVIIHSRKAEAEVFAELAAAHFPGQVIMHCFGGSKKLLEEGIRRRYAFSIPASIARATQFQLMAELVPLGQLFTETDSPYLSAGRETWPNTPASVVATVAHIAAIKRITPEECRQMLFMNVQRTFPLALR